MWLAQLTWAQLTWAQLTWAQLTWAQLTWAQLIWAQLIWAQLIWAQLIWAQLIWAQLTWAQLIWAQLIWALWPSTAPVASRHTQDRDCPIPEQRDGCRSARLEPAASPRSRQWARPPGAPRSPDD